MGTLNQKGLESLLQPIRDKINNYMPKSGGEFSGPISISNGYNKCTFSVNDSYSRITSGDSNLDFTNSGELLVNNKSIFEKDNSLKLGKIVNNSGQIIEKYEVNTNIPYQFLNGSAVAIGTDIYLLGSSYSNYNKYNYKYDTTTNTYTQNKNIPYNFYNGSAVAIGTDIYLLGSSYSDYNYKYDTTTNTYTQMANIPYKFHDGTAVAIGNDIYLLGGYDTKYNYYSYYNYKYDTTTNSYTKMTNIPYYYFHGSTVAIGTDIYLLGGYGNANNNYKYDTTTNSYTKLTDIPYYFSRGSAVAIGNIIYLLGGDGTNGYYNNYKYDTTTDTYTQNRDIPYNFYNGSAVAIDNNIYLLGGHESENHNYKYNYDIITSTSFYIKLSNHSIYTIINDTTEKSYIDKNASIISLMNDEYYTEYDSNNNIVNNTYPISSDGITKFYIKQGAILNGKEVVSESEGWQDINILDYM